MGMFDSGLGRILKSVVMGTNYVQADDERKRAEAEKDRLQQLMSEAAGLFSPIPGAMRQVPVGNAEGEDITNAFGPQMEQGPSRTRSPQEMAEGLAYYAKMGLPIKQLVDLASYAKPDIAYDRGYGYDKATGERAGEFHTELDKGMRPGPDGVVRNAAGYIDAAAEAAGAVTGAQEDAKAGRDMVKVDIGGQTVQLPRSVALPLITAAFKQSNPDGLPTDFGRTRSPEEQALLTGRAGNTVKQEGTVADAATQATLDLPKLRDQANNTLGVIAKIRAHPSLSARTGNSTLLPALRPEDVDFDVLVKQIGGGAFLEAIASLKGTGQITEIEGAKATEAVSRMQNQRQSQAGFMAAMNDYERIVRAGLTRAEKRAATAPARAGAPAGPRTQGPRGSRILSVE